MAGLATKSAGEGSEEVMVQVVEFMLGDERYAVDVSRVGSIVRAGDVTRVPGSSESVKGIMDLRGETTTVIDPRVLLGISTSGGGNQVLILDKVEMDQGAGLVVDNVSDIRDVRGDQVERMDSVQDLEAGGEKGKLAKGVIRRSDDSEEEVELVVWVDVDAIVEASGA